MPKLNVDGFLLKFSLPLFQFVLVWLLAEKLNAPPTITCAEVVTVSNKETISKNKIFFIFDKLINIRYKGTTKNRYMQIKIAFLRNFYSTLVYIQKN